MFTIRYLPWNIRLSLFNSCVLSNALYGSNAWNPTLAEFRKIEGRQFQLLQKLLGYEWEDKISHVQLIQIAANKGFLIIPIEVKIRQGMIRYAGHLVRRQEEEKKNILQLDLIHARIIVPEGDQVIGKRTTTANSYNKTMQHNLKYFGLDPNTWTEMAKSENKSEFRNYLIGDGLTKAMTTWLEGERKNKEGREEYKMRNRWKTKDDEEGQLVKEMEIYDGRIKEIIDIRIESQKNKAKTAEEKIVAKIEKEKKEQAKKKLEDWKKLSKHARQRMRKAEALEAAGFNKKVEDMITDMGEMALEDREVDDDMIDNPLKGVEEMKGGEPQVEEPLPPGFPPGWGDQRIENEVAKLDEMVDDIIMGMAEEVQEVDDMVDDIVRGVQGGAKDTDEVEEGAVVEGGETGGGQTKATKKTRSRRKYGKV